MTKLRELAESFANKTPIGIYSPDDIIQITYESGYRQGFEDGQAASRAELEIARKVVRLCRHEMEHGFDLPSEVFDEVEKYYKFKGIHGCDCDDCDCNCHKAPPVGWEAGRCCPDCGASITGGRFD